MQARVYALMLLCLGAGCLRPEYAQAMNARQSRGRKGRPVLQGPSGLQGHLVLWGLQGLQDQPGPSGSICRASMSRTLHGPLARQTKGYLRPMPLLPEVLSAMTRTTV